MRIQKVHLHCAHRSCFSFKHQTFLVLAAAFTTLPAHAARTPSTVTTISTEAALRKQLEIDPLDVSTLLSLAKLEGVSDRKQASSSLLHYSRGHWREFSAEAKEQIRLGNQDLHKNFLTDSAQTHYLQARELVQSGDLNSALSYAQQARVLEDDNWFVSELLRSIAVQITNPQIQLQAVTQMLAIDPWNRTLADEQIFLNFAARDFTAVITSYERAEEPSDDLAVRTAYAASLCEVGRYAQSLPILRALVRMPSSDPPLAQFYLAKSLSSAELGTPVEIRNLLRRFLNSFPPLGPIAQDRLHSQERLVEAAKLLQTQSTL